MHYSNFIGFRTDTGKNRAKNEDAFCQVVTQNGYLLAVSDGNGSFPGGLEAAQLAVGGLQAYTQRKSFGDAHLTEMYTAFQHANQLLLQKAYQDPLLRNMGASLAAVLIKGRTAYFGNIGECQIYLMRQESLSIISEDHRYVAELLKEGKINEKEALQHPRQNEITRRMGIKDTRPFVGARPLILENGDVIMLCSSGLTKMVEDGAIGNILCEADLTPQAKADKLINLANFRGGLENISVLVCEHQQVDEPVSNQQKPEAISIVQGEREQPKNAVYTIVSFMLFAVFMAALFFQAKSTLHLQKENALEKVDSLLVALQTQEAIARRLITNNDQAAQAISNHYFDAYDSDQYRIYGLFRDKEQRYTSAEVSSMFNVFNTAAVKSSNVMGERWFIVPVKGVHYLKGGETLSILAEKYYGNPADSVLIKKFNSYIAEGRYLFLPFGS